MKQKMTSIILTIIALAFLGCHNHIVSPEPPSGEKDITDFRFTSALNSDLTNDAVGIIAGTAIAVNVPPSTNVTGLIATFSTTGVSVSVNDVPQTSGVSVNDFTNPVTYKVTAEDITTKNYIVTVNRPAASSNTNLASLVLSPGSLSPAFDPATTSYSVVVLNSVNTITFTPKPEDEKVKSITVQSVFATPPNWSVEISLELGRNWVPIIVTAEDGTTTNTYHVIVTRRYGGCLDTSFHAGGGGPNGSVESIAILPDGKIIIVGYFTTYNQVVQNHIARLNSDGTLDQTFNVGGSGASNTVYAVAVQSDGMIIVGNFTTYNNTTRNSIARLNLDGTLDTSFDVGDGADKAVQCLAIQQDGKIVVAGNFTKINNQPRGCIARLEKEGSLDPDFTPDTSGGIPNQVRSVAIQENGRILIGGLFCYCNGIERGGFARLTEEGDLDPEFLALSVPATILPHTIVVLPDKNILIGGNFHSYNGAPWNCIARLYENGSLDTTFGGLPGPNGEYITCINVSPVDGKILIGGDFTNYDGQYRKYIARLTEVGSLDQSFGNPYGGPNNEVHCIAVQSDGRILIGGNFTEYDLDYGWALFARIWGE